WPGNFGAKAERHSLFGLDAEDELVCLAGGDGGVAKEQMRRSPKLDDNFRVATGQAFARPQVKGHIRPAPVVDLQLQGREGLRFRFASHAVFVPVSGNWFAVDRALRILAPDGPFGYILHGKGADGAEQF